MKESEKGGDLFEKMAEFGKHLNLKIPPPAHKDLMATFVEHVPGESMKMKFQLQEKHENPGGVILGGYFSAYFDATMGPFSFVETGMWTVSLDINVCFIKPLKVSDGEVLVHARLVSKTKSNLIIHAEAYKGDNVLVATCTSRMLIMKPKG
jgi:acyl-coenzyme A thioesterase PaaI-like protein